MKYRKVHHVTVGQKRLSKHAQQIFGRLYTLVKSDGAARRGVYARIGKCRRKRDRTQ